MPRPTTYCCDGVFHDGVRGAPHCYRVCDQVSPPFVFNDSKTTICN